MCVWVLIPPTPTPRDVSPTQKFARPSAPDIPLIRVRTYIAVSTLLKCLDKLQTGSSYQNKNMSENRFFKFHLNTTFNNNYLNYRDADTSLARPGRKQARKHVRRRARFQQHGDASCQVFFPLQCKVPKEIHAILTETLVCFLSGRAKDLSAPHVCNVLFTTHTIHLQVPNLKILEILFCH